MIAANRVKLGVWVKSNASIVAFFNHNLSIKERTGSSSDHAGKLYHCNAWQKG
jgi:hypothetical protein